MDNLFRKTIEINPKAVFQDFELEITFPTENQNQENPIIKLKDTIFQIQSKDLYNNLKNCHKVYLLACTLGPQVDSLIRKTQFTDQVMAAVFQATGAMYIEEVVDFANNRFSNNKNINFKCMSASDIDLEKIGKDNNLKLYYYLLDKHIYYLYHSVL